MGSPLGKQGQIVVALFMTSGFHSITLSNQSLFTHRLRGGRWRIFEITWFSGREREGGSIVADIDTGDYKKLTAEGGGGGRRMGIKQSLRKLGGDRVNVTFTQQNPPLPPL